MVRKVNLAEALALFDEHWSPKIVGQVNDTHVKLAKLHGEFVWHRHDDEDELFLVLKGSLLMKLRDGEIEIGEGELEADQALSEDGSSGRPPWSRRAGIGRQRRRPLQGFSDLVSLFVLWVQAGYNVRIDLPNYCRKGRYEHTTFVSRDPVVRRFDIRHWCAGGGW